MSDTKFEAGDTVSWCGTHGVVMSVCEHDNKDYNTSVRVYFEEVKQSEYFCFDGRYMKYHTEPSLKLVRKAKKKITVEYWVNVYKSGATHLCHTKQDAIFFAGFVCMNDSFLKTVHLSKEIEI